MIYCFDTSALILARRRAYPPDVFATLWSRLESFIDEGRLVSSHEVLLELERKDDGITDWAKTRAEIFMEPDEAAQQCLSQIVTDFPTFIPKTAPDGIWADPYVVAIAQACGYIVVTQERLAQPGQKRLSISDVCQRIAVPRIDFLGFLRREDWQV